MAGGLTISTLNDSSGVLATQNGMSGICKAWVNYNGVAGAIRASFNVASVTKNGTGDYTVNFTTAMPDTNYGVTLGPTIRSGGDANSIPRFYSAGTAATTSGYRVLNNEISPSRIAADTEFFYISFFR